MSWSDIIGPKIPLAADWLCANETCSIRWGDECPVYRIVKELTATQVWRVLQETNIQD